MVLEALATNKEELHRRISIAKAIWMHYVDWIVGGVFEVQRDR